MTLEPMREEMNKNTLDKEWKPSFIQSQCILYFNQLLLLAFNKESGLIQNIWYDRNLAKGLIMQQVIYSTAATIQIGCPSLSINGDGE